MSSAAAALQKLLDMSPSELAKIPAGTPPPGVTPNFDNPATRVPVITGVNTTFLALATMFLALRIYMKTFVIRNWKIEDAMLIAAWIIAFLSYVGGALTAYHGTMGKHTWDLHADSLFYPGWFYTYWMSTAVSLAPLGLAKLAILLQYWHLFSTKRSMKIAILVGIVAVSLFYFSFTIIYIVFTSPWPGESMAATVTSWHATYIATFTPPIGVVNVIMDFYVLLLPIPAVLQLKLSPSKKFGVMLMFLTGGLACAASIVCVYYRFQIDLKDLSWTIGYIFLWGQVEMWSGIIVACAPTVHMFWNRHSKLVWLSNVFKSSISRVSGSIGSSRHSSGRARANRNNLNRQHMQAAEDRGQMQRITHSMDSTRASTFAPARNDADLEFEDLELGHKTIPSNDQILVEHSFSVSANEKDHARSSEDSNTDVEAQK